MVVHLLSPNGRYDMTYLRNYAVLNVKDRLARMDGVGDVQLFGSGDYSMRVWLDPQKVAQRGLSAADVVARPSVARTCRPRPACGRVAGPGRRRRAAQRQRPGPAEDRGRVRRHHRQDQCRWRHHAPARHRAHRAGRGRLRAALAARQQAAVAIPSSSAGRPTPSTSATACAPPWPTSRRTCPKAWPTRSSTTRRSSCARPSNRWCTRCWKPLRWWCWW
jgi:hypothetical protein